MPDLLDRLRSALAERYTIEREIGRGGMATVFLAGDLKHRRKVAIKVLDPELAAVVGPTRFLREIEIVAGLAHPNILPLHDSGEAEGLLYYTMPYVEGESLRDRLDRERQLPLEETARIAHEVADALSHAHSAGIVHRDIKPANILFEAGHAVVADFGIARVASDAEGGSATRTGLAVGTPDYMSPEQADGEAVDERTDVYALGCLVYEMLAGEAPLSGPSRQAVAARRRRETPSPLELYRPAIPAAVDDVIRRALQPVPADRYQAVREWADDLARAIQTPDLPAPRSGTRWTVLVASVAALVIVAAAAVWFVSSRGTAAPDGPVADASHRTSIAVLPFSMIGGTEEDEYFADGIHDVVLTHLHRVDGLSPLARTTVLQYRDQQRDMREIGTELGVDAVMEATVQHVGNTIRINAQLIDTETGEHLWADIYDRELTADNLLEAQSDIARQIALALDAELTPDVEARIDARPTDNLEAYELYLKAYALLQRTEGHAEAARSLEQAIELDPDFALAYARLGQAVYNQSGSPLPRNVRRDSAMTLARKALELDETIGEAHATLGLLHDIGWEWRLAEAEYRKAIELSPSYANTYMWFGEMLREFGRAEEALELTLRAKELNPQDPTVRFQLGMSYYVTGDYDRAITELGEQMHLFPDVEGLAVVSALYEQLAYFQTGMYEEVLAEAKGLGQEWGRPTCNFACIAVLAATGLEAEARDSLEVLRAFAPGRRHAWIARGYVAVGDFHSALALLDTVTNGTGWRFQYFKSDPMWEPIRSDPRFGEILRKIGLE
jgi:serine/threonine-protein kinase